MSTTEVIAPTQPVGWTAARMRRTWWFAGALAVAAVAALWAMVLPWVGLSLGDQPPACVIGDHRGSVRTYDQNNQVTEVAASGCTSAYQSVHLATLTGPDQVTVHEPFGVPEMRSKMGIPSMTFWLVAAALVGILALAMRNSLVLLPAILMLNASNHAFVDHRAALMFGMDSLAGEMVGVKVHQYAFAAVVLTLVSTAAFLIKVNVEQRKLDMAAYKSGERENPPGLIFAQLVGSYMLRGNIEKLSNAAEAAKAEARAG